MPRKIQVKTLYQLSVDKLLEYTKGLFHDYSNFGEPITLPVRISEDIVNNNDLTRTQFYIFLQEGTKKLRIIVLYKIPKCSDSLSSCDWEKLICERCDNIEDLTLIVDEILFDHSIIRIILKFREKIRRLKIGGQIHVLIFESISEDNVFQNLQSLNLESFLDETLGIYLDLLGAKFLQCFCNLEELRIGPPAGSVVNNNSTFIKIIKVPKLLFSLPKLRIIYLPYHKLGRKTVRKLKVCDKIREITVRKTYVPGIVNKFPNLEVFSTHKLSKDKFCEVTGNEFLHLRVFDMNETDYEFELFEDFIIKRGSNLKILRLNKTKNVNIETVIDFCRNLEDLAIQISPESSTVVPSDHSQVVPYKTKLKTVHINQFPRGPINGGLENYLESLLDNSSTLEILKINIQTERCIIDKPLFNHGFPELKEFHSETSFRRGGDTINIITLNNLLETENDLKLIKLKVNHLDGFMIELMQEKIENENLDVVLQYEKFSNLVD